MTERSEGTGQHGTAISAGGLSLVEYRAPDALDSTPVLMLHGIGGSARSMDALGGELAGRGRHALAWDAPGYGASADPGEPGTDPAARYVDRVARVVADLGGHPVHLLGVSWGGVITTEVAARRPELVATLILVDSTRGSGSDPARARAMLRRVTDLVELGSRAFAAIRAPRLLAAGATAIARQNVESEMARVRVPGYRGAAEMMAHTDTGPLLPTLRVPTLVVVGAEDRVTGVAESALLAGRITGARLAVVPDAGHAAVQERPDAVATLVTEFLADSAVSAR